MNNNFLVGTQKTRERTVLLLLLYLRVTGRIVKDLISDADDFFAGKNENG